MTHSEWPATDMIKSSKDFFRIDFPLGQTKTEFLSIFTIHYWTFSLTCCWFVCEETIITSIPFFVVFSSMNWSSIISNNFTDQYSPIQSHNSTSLPFDVWYWIFDCCMFYEIAHTHTHTRTSARNFSWHTFSLVENFDQWKNDHLIVVEIL